MKRKKVIISGLIIVIITLGIIGVYKALNGDSSISSILNQFKSFSVTIENKSNYDIVEIETGILESDSHGKVMEGESRVKHLEILKSGSSITLKPALQLKGEGGIYLKFTDSNGESTTKTICSYTETLSGSSHVTINNDTVNVKENCS